MTTEHPLEKTFNLPTQEDIEELENRLEIELPDDAGLKDIAKLALDAYKNQLQEIHRIEPKYRARAFEVAQMYLDVAKDALGKEADVKLKKEKMDIDAGKNDKPDSEPRIPKREILDELKVERLKRVK
jgi:hypothetical protein